MPDDLVELASRRMLSVMLGVAVAGSMLLWAWRGWTWGAGFAVGSFLSWLNFRWLKRAVNTLSGAERPSRQAGFLAAFRYLLLGGGVYAILAYTPISAPAALAGLFVAVAAV